MTDRLAVEFLGTFESLRMGPTFARGRRDEKAGHVRELTVSGSLVVARVRGPEDATVFRARIAVRAFGATEWARVEQDLVAEARFVADLLAGRMPAGIEAVFAAAGLGLVPLSLDEVAMDCSCERWPMPCVHLAATIYALARSFEEDPFGVFTWRGRSRDELLMHLRELRGASAVSADPVTASAGLVAASAGAGADPVDLSSFWGEAAPPPLVPAGGRPGAATRPDALLDQLDPPPLAHDGRPITDLLRSAYLALPEEENSLFSYGSVTRSGSATSL
ncbi:SWIM zinc finger family protein [Micromonosporaceae bacterium Da 78-11]